MAPRRNEDVVGSTWYVSPLIEVRLGPGWRRRHWYRSLPLVRARDLPRRHPRY